MNTSTLRLGLVAPVVLLALAGSASMVGAATCPKAAEHAAAAGLLAPRATGAGTFAVVPVRGEESKSESEHSWSDGKNNVRIVRKDGKVQITLNGEEIMNLDDADVFRGNIGDLHSQAGRQMWAQRMRGAGRGGMAAPAPGAWSTNVERPRVMIGVTMETAEEANAKVPAGVEPDQATVITRVVEGLPAEKGGLEEGDIVIRINGATPAAPDDIREAIKDKNAGDQLKLHVVRAGSDQDVVISLAAYDGERLGAPGAWGFGNGAGGKPEPMNDEDLKQLKDLHEKMAASSAELEKLGAALANAKSDEEREHISNKMGEVGEEMAELGSDMGSITGHGGWNPLLGQQYGLNMKDMPRMRIERGNGGPSKAFIFTPDGQSGAGDEDRIKKLDERLERLEKLLERVAEEKEKSHR